MEQRYNLMKNGECIGTYNGFQVEMLYMEWAEKWLKKYPKDRDCLYLQLTAKYMENNNLEFVKVN